MVENTDEVIFSSWYINTLVTKLTSLRRSVASDEIKRVTVVKTLSVVKRPRAVKRQNGVSPSLEKVNQDELSFPRVP